MARKATAVMYILLIALTIAGAWGQPEAARAQDESGFVIYSNRFIPLEDFSKSERLSDLYSAGNLGEFLNRLFVAAIILGAVLAVLRLSFAGFQYMASDLWTSKDKAKEIIRETFLGLFLLLAVWIILNQINPDILKLQVSTSRQQSNTAPAQSTSVFNAGSGNAQLQDTTPGDDVNSGIRY